MEFQHSMGFWQNPPELMEEGKVKGALAIECRTYTQLVSPAKGPKKKKMEVLTTQAQDHCRASY